MILDRPCSSVLRDSLVIRASDFVILWTAIHSAFCILHSASPSWTRPGPNGIQSGHLLNPKKGVVQIEAVLGDRV
jgi:hypothetical protein